MGRHFRVQHTTHATRSRSKDAAAATAYDDKDKPQGNVTLIMENLTMLLPTVQQSNADMLRRLTQEVSSFTPAQGAVEPANMTVVVAPSPAVSGNFSKYQATTGSAEETLEGFINAVEAYEYKDCCNISEENSIRGFLILLTHFAATWWQGIKFLTTSCTVAVDHLRRAFGDRQPPHRLYRNLFDNEQQCDENIDQFVARARDIFSRLPTEDLSEKVRLDMVYGLLHQRMRERLHREEFTSFDELLSKAHSIEDAFKGRVIPGPGMWAYIIAAARGDSRQAMARNPDECTFSYRDGQVFMVSGPRMDEPGPSGINTKEMFDEHRPPTPKDCSPVADRDIRSPLPFSRDLAKSPPPSSKNCIPLKSLTSPSYGIDDVIEICDDEVSAFYYNTVFEVFKKAYNGIALKKLNSACEVSKPP